MTASSIVLVALCSVIFIVILAAVIVANIEVSAFLAPRSRAFRKFNFMAKEKPPVDESGLPEIRKIIRENRKAILAEAGNWMNEAEKKDLYVTTSQGIKLHSLFFPGASSHKYVICVHGYCGLVKYTAVYGVHFYNEGYNVLLPENRTTGESGGNMIGMGWQDKNDILLWINHIIEKDPEASIVLHGESMGAATVMMLTGEKLPANVRCVISDCGYTSVWSQFDFLRKKIFHWKTYPMLPVASLMCKIRGGYFFREASSVCQLKKSVTPTFFVHGGCDDFVPASMLRENYISCSAPKDWFMFPDAKHCESVMVNPELYWVKVMDFVKKYN